MEAALVYTLNIPGYANLTRLLSVLAACRITNWPRLKSYKGSLTRSIISKIHITLY